MRWTVPLILAASMSCHPMTSSVRAPQGTTAHDDAMARYHTFSFVPSGQPPAGYELSGRSLKAERSARDELVVALVRKGYIEVRENADLLVRLSSGTRDVSSFDAETGYHPPFPEEASVTIDVFDSGTALQVWHAVALTDGDTREIDDSRLRSEVRTALTAVPDRRSPAVVKPDIAASKSKSNSTSGGYSES